MRWFRHVGREDESLTTAQRSVSNAVRLWELGLDEANYFVIDLETSGFSAERDLVLSLAAGCMRGSDGERLEPLYYDVVRQTALDRVPAEVWTLTGLSPADVAGGSEWIEVLQRALQLSAGRVWIGHHIRHDLSFISRYARVFWKMRLHPIAIDTALVAQALSGCRKVPTLDETCRWLNVPMGRRHHAAEDVRMTAAVWQKEIALCQRIGLQTVRDVVEWSLARASG